MILVMSLGPGPTPRKFSSPSAGLRYKVLTLPGEFELSTPKGVEAFSSDGFYAIRGRSRNWQIFWRQLPAKVSFNG